MIISFPKQQQTFKGFTLLEILIALGIFAIVSVITTTLLAQMFNHRQAVKQRAEALSEIQFATALMQQDFTQMVNRPVRAANGNLLPAIIATANYLEFTRNGNHNPLASGKRSDLLRVAYELKNNQLVRKTWPRLDRVDGLSVQSRVLLEQVTAGEFKYADWDHRFLSNWPPANLLNRWQIKATPIPPGIDVDLNLANWGHYRLLVAIPAHPLL